ncbi:MAG: hypothetical protein II320_02645, partial [Oscillospiraceae bacterium]|nr:hypothetical protein [Oscillospiraceae bacterium]
GFQTEVEIHVHNGGLIETDPMTWLESEHTYKNSFDETQVLTVSGADFIRFTFSVKTSVEDSYDHIYVYDGNDVLVATYTGTAAAGSTLTIQGDTVKIRLVTDGAENGWGYSLSNVEAYRVEHVYETEGGDCIHCVRWRPRKCRMDLK